MSTSNLMVIHPGMNETEKVEAANKALIDVVLPLYRDGKTAEAKKLEDSIKAALNAPNGVTIKTLGIRHNEPDLFNASKFTQMARWNQDMQYPHNAFLVLDAKGCEVTVRAVNTLRGIFNFPDETRVIVRWPGVNRSDYFIFTVGEARTNLGIPR